MIGLGLIKRVQLKHNDDLHRRPEAQRLACVAAVSFPFLADIEHVSEKAGERRSTPGVSTPSQFHSLRVRFWKRLLHRLPRQVCSSLLFIVALLFLRPNLKRISIPPCFYKSHFFYTGANPCGKNNGSCAHNCVRNGSKYNCSCSTGFRLESDLHNCEGKKKWRVVICCGHQ